MPRLMSVAYTEPQVLDRTKDVTRRLGWRFAKVGDRVILCRKVMGRKAGEPLVRLVAVEFVQVHREPLSSITWDDVRREGFPGMHPDEFLRRFFTEAQGITDLSTEVARIHYRYLEDACLLCGRDVPPGWLESDEWQASRYCITCLNGPVPS